MSHPLDLAAADLGHADALQHLEHVNRWAGSVLERDPTSAEVRRARIMLRARAQETAPALPVPWRPPPRDEPVALPCGRCGRERACTWNGVGWERPGPCDGFACGYLGQAHPVVPAARDLQGILQDMRGDVWAFQWADPAWAHRRAQELGALQLFIETLEAIALDADPASQELARRALELQAGLLPRQLPELPSFDLAEVDGPEPERLSTRELLIRAAQRSDGPLARRVRAWDEENSG